MRREQHEGVLNAKAFKCNRCRYMDMEIISVGGYGKTLSFAFPMYKCKRMGLHLRKMTKCPKED